MSWTLLFAVVLLLGLSLFARRVELSRMAKTLDERDAAIRRGSADAQLTHPVIDLTTCFGCGACVAACPEEGVLGLVHGQAVVLNGARCVGVAACERVCPVGAIQVTVANLDTRLDIPVLTPGFEAIGSPGLFLAGEVTGQALIKRAIEQGTQIAAEVGRRTRQQPTRRDELDLCIVGAGPAGLACALEAKRLGLRFVVLEQEHGIGGTVAKYPRRKLVLADPVELPLHGRLANRTYTKEDLIELWQRIADLHALPIQTGAAFDRLDRVDNGGFRVATPDGAVTARHVCLAVGRRGMPRRLGVPGEGLPKVTYGLLDAQSYQGRHILVVGGGDTAAETAIGLAEQPGNQVTLSYRREGFFRLRQATDQRLRALIDQGRVRVVWQSVVRSIEPAVVHLEVKAGDETQVLTLPNDDVFVMAGGIAPVDLLRAVGVSFDPALRPLPLPRPDAGAGLAKALAIGFGMALLTLGWALWHQDYYLLPGTSRPEHDKHALLRPGFGLGLGFGIAATVLVVVNLLYLLRRSARFRFGSLRTWMTAHVATGVLALLAALLHSAMAPRQTPGGHAFWAMAVLIVTGAIGRYFYAQVPRAANGRELALAEVKGRLQQRLRSLGHGSRAFGEHARQAIETLVNTTQWHRSFASRVLGIIQGHRALRRLLAQLRHEGRQQRVSHAEMRETLDLARRAYGLAVTAAHYEDLRAVLNSWRYLHRWVAVLMVLLLVIHIVHALVYSEVLTLGGRG